MSKDNTKDMNKNVLVTCACGQCNELICPVDAKGRPRRFAKGHNAKKINKYDPDELVQCECRCGEMITRYDERGRERRFLPGHKSISVVKHEEKDNETQLIQNIKTHFGEDVENKSRYELLSMYWILGLEHIHLRQTSVLKEDLEWEHFEDRFFITTLLQIIVDNIPNFWDDQLPELSPSQDLAT